MVGHGRFGPWVARAVEMHVSYRAGKQQGIAKSNLHRVSERCRWGAVGLRAFQVAVHTAGTGTVVNLAVDTPRAGVCTNKLSAYS